MRCAHCGIELFNLGELCFYHLWHGESWAESNKAWCDALHRQIFLPREPMTESERKEFYA